MPTKPNDGGSTTSIWADAAPHCSESTPAPSTEVCIVGAGIAGLTLAYELAREGVQVTVLDDGPIGGGETGRTSAHLASAVDEDFHHLEAQYGAEGARLVAESHAAAIDFIEDTAESLGIDCDFHRVDAYLFGPAGKDERTFLEKELEASRRAGLDVSMIDRAPLPWDTGPALRYRRQAEFHPLEYLGGLAAAVTSLGGKIHCGVHVEMIEPGQPLTVKLAGGHRVLCRTAVDATNGAFTSPLKLTIRQAAYRTYMVGLDISADVIPHALYWDTLDPYHYLRVVPGTGGRETLIVGGGDHRVGQGDPEAAWKALEEWTRQRFPMAGARVARWSGQIIEPAGGLAHIGRSPDLEHVFVVTGDSGNGLTHGTIAGLMLPTLIRGGNHRWAKLYDPQRSHLSSFGTLVGEAAKSSAPYTDWLRGGDVASAEQIAPGHGAVVRRGLHLVAVYKDEAGACHERSATCPHLRGVVHWNDGEKTWDCPCHGSRFDAYGRVVNGPASTDLRVLGGEASDAELPSGPGRVTHAGAADAERLPLSRGAGVRTTDRDRR